MKCNVLVNLLDVHNEANLIAIESIKPKKVIYLISEDLINIYEEIKKYHENNLFNIEIESIKIDSGDIYKIQSILDNLFIKDTIVNVTGGKRINSLILLNTALNNGFNCIYVDVLASKWYNLGEKISEVKSKFNDIYLDDILKISGANMIVDSTDLSKRKDIINITKKIYSNLDIWYKYKQRLYDNSIFIHDYKDNKKIIIDLRLLNKTELCILDRCLEYLLNKNEIIYKNENDTIIVEFLNNYLKGFIFKSGTWLEVLTNVVVEEISEIDEVRNGVVFLWDDKENKVKNELDVLAVKDSVLICISCKDSEKYDENALNELAVYSDRLGGKKTRKILVATKPPCKECVMNRAKAMNIDIVVLERNIEKFKKTLIEIINKEI